MKKPQELIPYRVHLRQMHSLRVDIKRIEDGHTFLEQEIEKLRVRINEIYIKDMMNDINYCLDNHVNESMIKKIEDKYTDLEENHGVVFSDEIKTNMSILKIKAVCIA